MLISIFSFQNISRPHISIRVFCCQFPRTVSWPLFLLNSPQAATCRGTTPGLGVQGNVNHGVMFKVAVILIRTSNKKGANFHFPLPVCCFDFPCIPHSPSPSTESIYTEYEKAPNSEFDYTKYFKCLHVKSGKRLVSIVSRGTFEHRLGWEFG